MNLYTILFERLFAFFHRGASTNPSHEKFDGAVLTCTIISCLIFINLLSVMHIIRLSFSTELKIKASYAIGTIIILITLNFLYFLRQKKYLLVSSFVKSLPQQKRSTYSIITVIYSLGSIGLFFLLLCIGK